MDQEDPVVIELGDKPNCGRTWLWGRDEPDGTRIDRYAANDGYLYERIALSCAAPDPGANLFGPASKS